MDSNGVQCSGPKCDYTAEYIGNIALFPEKKISIVKTFSFFFFFLSKTITLQISNFISVSKQLNFPRVVSIVIWCNLILSLFSLLFILLTTNEKLWDCSLHETCLTQSRKLSFGLVKMSWNFMHTLIILPDSVRHVFSNFRELWDWRKIFWK